jgi:hypothetical protein
MQQQQQQRLQGSPAALGRQHSGTAPSSLLAPGGHVFNGSMGPGARLTLLPALAAVSSAPLPMPLPNGGLCSAPTPTTPAGHASLLQAAHSLPVPASACMGGMGGMVPVGGSWDGRMGQPMQAAAHANQHQQRAYMHVHGASVGASGANMVPVSATMGSPLGNGMRRARSPDFLSLPGELRV